MPPSRKAGNRQQRTDRGRDRDADRHADEHGHAPPGRELAAGERADRRERTLRERDLARPSP